MEDLVTMAADIVFSRIVSFRASMLSIKYFALKIKRPIVYELIRVM